MRNSISAYRFDPAGPFVASRQTTLSGVTYAAGDTVPNDAAPTRRLRQLYERRHITMQSQFDEHIEATLGEKAMLEEQDRRKGADSKNEKARAAQDKDDAKRKKAQDSEAKRAREDDGTYKGDDPATPGVNEAWEGGEAPTDADTATEGTEQAAEGQDEAEGAQEAGKSAYEAIHKGFGKWVVADPDGTEIFGPVKKAEAHAEADRLNSEG